MTTMTAAATQYASRPKDERFPTVAALVDNAAHERDLSKEVVYNVKDLHAVPTGDRSLQIASPKGAANMTHWSFGQLSRIIGAPAGYLRTLPATVAADAINYGLRETAAGTRASLLVRAANGTPEPTVRAMTSDRYARVWDAPLYGEIQRQIMNHDDRWTTPPTWSGESAGAYRGDRDSFLILVNGGSIVTDPSVGQGTDGRMFRGILVRNSEVGAAAISIEQIMFRYVCGNHNLWGAVTDKSFRRRHVGAGTMSQTLRVISQIAHDFTHASPARDEAIIKGLIANEIATTKDGVIDELHALGMSKDVAERAYDRCVQTEAVSPRSFWGMAQGITRLSQDSGYQDDRFVLDQLASKVLARGARQLAVA